MAGEWFARVYDLVAEQVDVAFGLTELVEGFEPAVNLGFQLNGPQGKAAMLRAASSVETHTDPVEQSEPQVALPGAVFASQRPLRELDHRISDGFGRKRNGAAADHR